MKDLNLTDIVELTSLISAAGLDPRKWQGFVDHLHHVTDGIKIHLSGLDLRAGIYLGITSAGYDPDRLATYDAHFGTMNRWMDGIAAKQTGIAYHLDNLWVREDFERTEFYNDWIRPQDDIAGGGASMLFNDDSRMFILGGNVRRRDIDRLESNWLTLAQMLTPHLENALEVNRVLAGMALDTYALGAASGSRRSAVLAVNRDRQVLFSNPPAKALLEDGGALRHDMLGRLWFGTHADRWFQKALALFDRSPLFQPQTLEIANPETGARYLCRLCAIEPEKMDHSPMGVLLGPGDPALLITLTGMAAPAEAAERLAAQYRLTPTEARVALEIAAGLSPRDIACHHGTSPHTTRNQLKSTMAKMGVGKQLDLARIVAQAGLNLD
jgi:DNA-binding CsgD family transcriptional regulator